MWACRPGGKTDRLADGKFTSITMRLIILLMSVGKADRLADGKLTSITMPLIILLMIVGV